MYAILGILNITPSTGYDIKKYCDTVLSGFWNENFGHIYPTLKKMHEDGTIEIDSDVATEKKIRYKITALGKQELEKWMLEETELQPVRSEFMLKLIFSSNQPVETVQHMLLEYKEIHEKKLQKYLSMQSELDSGIEEITNNRALYVRAILRSGILSCETTIRWCDETRKELTA